MVLRWLCTALVVALVASALVVVADVEDASAGSSINPASLTSGFTHGCVLNAGGQVLCWGQNNHGQLGDGTTKNRSVPAPVVGITGATAVSAGQYHTCAVIGGGEVKCWGSNTYGQVGDGTTGTDRLTPVTVSGLTSVVKLALGYHNSCSLDSIGATKCWGRGDFGQNGDGSGVDRLLPVSVAGVVGGATDIAAGNTHVCAINASSEVYCWGYNNFGQVRGAVGAQSNGAVAVTGGLTGATTLGLGQYFSCATLASGGVKCWGDNGFGALGDGTGVDSVSPVDVFGISTATQVAGGYLQACASLADGTVKCWGQQNNLLADGSGLTSLLSPAPVTGISGSVGVVSGGLHSCVLLVAGTACWGNNNVGQLGNNSTAVSPGAATVVGVTPEGAATFVRPVPEALGTAASTVYTGDPVGTAFGNFFDHWVDVGAPNKAFGLEVERWYNSLDNQVGALGMGWRTSYSETVVDNGDGSVSLTLGEGRVIGFEPDGSGGFENALEFGGQLSIDGGGLYSVEMPDGEVWDFDSGGLIASKTRWDGVSATVTRDGSGRVQQVDASTGEYVEFGYDLTGRLASVESSDGRAVSYGYDPTSGFLVEVVDVDGKSTEIVPDGSGRVEQIVDPTGIVLVDNTFDLSGRVKLQVTPQGTTSFVYDRDLRTTVVTQVEFGESITYTHD